MFAGKKILLLGLIAVLLAAIPLTVYFVQRQQETRSQAQKSTTLSFIPATVSATQGEKFNIDVSMNPSQNLVSLVKLDISYDPTKLATSSATSSCADAICPNTTSFQSVLEGPIYSPGKISLTVSVGADSTKVIQSTTKVATITFSAKSPTGSTPTQLTFGNDTQVLSTATTDQASENVLSTTSPALITIAQGATTPTPTPNINTTPTPTQGAQEDIIQHKCGDTAKTVDRKSDVATDTREWEMGKNQGTVNLIINTLAATNRVQVSYENKQIYDTGSITTTLDEKTVPITFGPGNSTKLTVAVTTQNSTSQSIWEYSVTCSSTASVIPTSTPTPIPTVAIPTPTLLPPISITKPGPGEVIVGVGLFGVLLSVIGAALFFAL